MVELMLHIPFGSFYLSICQLLYFLQLSMLHGYSEDLCIFLCYCLSNVKHARWYFLLANSLPTRWQGLQRQKEHLEPLLSNFPLVHTLHTELVWGGNLIAKQNKEHISSVHLVCGDELLESSASNKGSSTPCHTLNHEAGRLISEHTRDVGIAENLGMFSWYIKAQIGRKWLLSTEIYSTPELTIGNEKHTEPTKASVEANQDFQSSTMAG